MDNKYMAPKQPKEIKSFTLSKENVEWIKKNIPEKQRSAFVDETLNRRIRYITRQQQKAEMS